MRDEACLRLPRPYLSRPSALPAPLAWLPASTQLAPGSRGGLGSSILLRRRAGQAAASLGADLVRPPVRSSPGGRWEPTPKAERPALQRARRQASPGEPLPAVFS